MFSSSEILPTSTRALSFMHLLTSSAGLDSWGPARAPSVWLSGGLPGR